MTYVKNMFKTSGRNLSDIWAIPIVVMSKQNLSHCDPNLTPRAVQDINCMLNVKNDDTPEVRSPVLIWPESLQIHSPYAAQEAVHLPLLIGRDPRWRCVTGSPVYDH